MVVSFAHEIAAMPVFAALRSVGSTAQSLSHSSRSPTTPAFPLAPLDRGMTI